MTLYGLIKHVIYHQCPHLTRIPNFYTQILCVENRNSLGIQNWKLQGNIFNVKKE